MGAPAMIHSSKLVPLVVGLCVAASPAWSEEKAAPSRAPAAAPVQVPGWEAFVENLRTLPSRMLAKLPEDQRNDPQVQQEVARLALESLATSTLTAIGGDGDHP